MNVRFSRDPAHGSIDIARDGRPVLTDYHPPGGTLLDSANYLKTGLYRARAITDPGTVTLEHLAVDTTADSS